MLFKPEYIELIKNGTKTQTRRGWKNRRAKPGGVYKVQLVPFRKDYECKIKIKAVTRERLGDITAESANAEGGFTVEEFKQKWIESSGGFDPDEEVWVIDFRVVDEDGIPLHEPDFEPVPLDPNIDKIKRRRNV
jgi:hypothetical protein